MRLKKFLVNSLLTSSLILSTFAISHPITTTSTVHAEYSTKLTDNAELIFENDDKDSGKLYINGIFQKDFTGLAYDYYFEKGVRSKFEGLQKIGNDVFLLWMYRPLHIFSTYLIRYKLPSDTSAKLYYIGKNAKIDFTFTGLAYYHVPPHVSDQRITSEEWNKAFTASNEYRPQLFYVKNGEVDWKFTGIAQNPINKNWFYVKNGEVDWTFTGIVTHTNQKTYYIQKGFLKWGVNTTLKQNGKVYTIKNSTVVK